MKKMKFKSLGSFLRKSLGILSIALAMMPSVNAQDQLCTAVTCGSELARNGDFESGNTAFKSDFHLVGSPYPGSGRNYSIGDCQVYAVGTSSATYNPGHWWTKDDHTYGYLGGGKFFIGDAQCDAQIKRAWYQKIKVNQGKTYAFSAWASNLDNATYTNMVIFTITDKNGVVITQSAPITSKGTQRLDRWTKVCGTYTALQTDSVQIEIKVVPSVPAKGLMGADFGLDDISFKAISPGSADFTITRRTNCDNDYVVVEASNKLGVHTWNFGSSQASPATANTPVASTIYTQPGTFTITHTVTAPYTDCVETKTMTVVVNDCPPLKECNSALDQCGSNLITNGNFSSGATGFTSQLSNLAGFSTCNGNYAVATSSTTYSGTDNKGSTWTVANDHTSGSGKFLIGDPPCTNPGVTVWRQSKNVVAGAQYNFSAWLSNLSPNNNIPNVVLRINGNLITNPTTIPYRSDTYPMWVKICGEYVAPTTGSVTLEVEIFPSSDLGTAADFGLDDIGFYRLGKVDATFSGNPGRVCSGTSTTFVSAQATGVNHYWNFGNSTYSSVANPSVTYATPGTYTVSHTVTDPATTCSKTSSQQIIIENCCSVTSAWTSAPTDEADQCEMSFTDNSTYSTETGGIDSWFWTFYDIDGTTWTSTAQNPIHEFSGPGPHRVCLEVTGTGGGQECKSEYCQDINPPCELKICDIRSSFEWSNVPTDPTTPSTITLFFNSTSYFSNSTLAGNSDYYWTFSNTTTGAKVVGTATPGEVTFYKDLANTTVTLTITARDNCDQDAYCQVIDFATLAGTACSVDPTHIKDLIAPLMQEQSDQIFMGNNSIKAYPNPFSTSMNIDVNTKEDGELVIDIVDINGRVVSNITKGNSVKGQHSFTWNPETEIANGFYMIRARNQSEVTYRKVNFLR